MSRPLEDPDNLGSKPTDDWMGPGVRAELERDKLLHSPFAILAILAGGAIGLLVFLAVASLILRAYFGLG